MTYRLVIEPQQVENNQIILTPQQHHYLTRVVRLKKGDHFIAMDGQGNCWVARIEEDKAEIIQSLEEATELPLKITLMVAIVKGNGFDEIVRCCTELGVNQIIPIITVRTLQKPSKNKIERWRKIAQEATEQSERQIVPLIIEPIPFTQAITEIDAKTNNTYICVTRQQAPHLLTCLTQSHNDQIVIATGPEGGWDVLEIEKAIAAGFQPVNLGSRILRAITAPIAALSIIAAVGEKGGKHGDKAKA